MTLVWRGQEALSSIEEAQKKANAAAAEFILGESNKKVPHEYGTLEQSGTADADAEGFTVSYGTVYAVPQHEHLEYNHSEGREAKYLENAVINNRDDMLEIMKDEIKKALE